jgi:hypothetical protein
VARNVPQSVAGRFLLRQPLIKRWLVGAIKKAEDWRAGLMGQPMRRFSWDSVGRVALTAAAIIILLIFVLTYLR